MWKTYIFTERRNPYTSRQNEPDKLDSCRYIYRFLESIIEFWYNNIVIYSLLCNNYVFHCMDNDSNVHYNKGEEKRLFQIDGDTNERGWNFQRGKHIWYNDLKFWNNF